MPKKNAKQQRRRKRRRKGRSGERKDIFFYSPLTKRKRKKGALKKKRKRKKMPRGSLDDRTVGALRVTVRMGASRRRSVLRCVVSEHAPRRNLGNFSEGSCSPCQVPLLAGGKRLGTKRLPSLLYIQITPYTALIPQRSWLEA